jgi:glycosyltransferase involved in cell wall biosynthesis
VGGGAELVLQSQANAMAERGHKVTVLTIGQQTAAMSFETVGQVSIIRSKFHNVYFHLSKLAPPPHEKLLWHIRDRHNFKMGRVAADVARKVTPDIVCIHNIAGWSIAIWHELQRLGLPLVQVLHDQYLMCAKSTMFRDGRNCAVQCLDCRLLRRRHRDASRQLTGVIGVSHFILDRLSSAGFFSGVKHRRVIHNVSSNPVPLMVPRAGNGDARALCLGFIGGLTESKGIRFLLDEVRRAGLAGIRLLVAGRGEDGFVNQLKADFADINAEFLGFIKADDFFRRIDLTIVPSLWNDTYPSVVFESLGYGVPVIASCRGGIPEMVEDGVNGFIFDPDVDGSLASILLKILQSPQVIDDLRAECARHASRYCDTNTWISSQEDFYEECLSDHA